MSDGGFLTGTYTQDNLLAGGPLFTDVGTLAESQDVVRGEVLGRVTASGEVVSSLAASSDGSETAELVALEARTTGVGETAEIPVVVFGKVNENALTFGAGHDVSTTKADLKTVGIYLAPSSSA